MSRVRISSSALGKERTLVSGPIAPAVHRLPTAALDFYDDLEMDNTKSFWTKHKHVYDEAVKAPMEALMAALAPEFAPRREAA